MKYAGLFQVFLVFSLQMQARERSSKLPIAGEATKVYVAIMGTGITSHIFVVLKDSKQTCSLDRWHMRAVCLPSRYRFPKELSLAYGSGKVVNFEVEKSMVEILEEYKKLHKPIWMGFWRPMQVIFDNCADEVTRIMEYLFTPEKWGSVGERSCPIGLPQVVFRKAKRLCIVSR